MLQVLSDVCSIMTEWNLYTVITSASGSHVARRLLCVLTGRDVTPASQRGKGQVCALPPLPCSRVVRAWDYPVLC